MAGCKGKQASKRAKSEKARMVSEEQMYKMAEMAREGPAQCVQSAGGPAAMIALTGHNGSFEDGVKGYIEIVTVSMNKDQCRAGTKIQLFPNKISGKYKSAGMLSLMIGDEAEIILDLDAAEMLQKAIDQGM